MLIEFTMYIERGEWPPRRIANWLSLSPHACHASQETEETEENVRCVMGYYQACCIVNLIVILDSVFRTAAGNETENAALPNFCGGLFVSTLSSTLLGDVLPSESLPKRPLCQVVPLPCPSVSLPVYQTLLYLCASAAFNVNHPFVRASFRVGIGTQAAMNTYRQ